MKQSELDKELRAGAKRQAKARGWKCVQGTLYWQIGPLFFTLVLGATVKQGTFYCSLKFKWLQLDAVLWRVLGLQGNETERFSLHANGAFSLVGQELLTISKRSLEWAPTVLSLEVNNASQEAYTCASEVSAQVASIEAYLEFIRKRHAEFMQCHPRAATNLYKEEVLVAMLAGDLPEATRIAQSRISARDQGGFVVGGRSFFQRALEQCNVNTVLGKL
jgi:hypothetical protein